jgi:hypothetical protein
MWEESAVESTCCLRKRKYEDILGIGLGGGETGREGKLLGDSQ